MAQYVLKMKFSVDPQDTEGLENPACEQGFAMRFLNTTELLAAEDALQSSWLEATGKFRDLAAEHGMFLDKDSSEDGNASQYVMKLNFESTLQNKEDSDKPGFEQYFTMRFLNASELLTAEGVAQEVWNDIMSKLRTLAAEQGLFLDDDEDPQIA